MINHIEVPNYVFFSNFTESSYRILGEVGPVDTEFCIKKTLRVFPHIPREAIHVIDNPILPGYLSAYVAKEFAPDVDKYMLDLLYKISQFMKFD